MQKKMPLPTIVSAGLNYWLDTFFSSNTLRVMIYRSMIYVKMISLQTKRKHIERQFRIQNYQIREYQYTPIQLASISFTNARLFCPFFNLNKYLFHHNANLKE